MLSPPLEKVRVADVVVDPRAGGLDSTWTYRIEGEASEGDAFFVPLGTRAVIGFATRIYETDEEQLQFPISQLKEVLDRIGGLSLPAQVMALVRFVSEEYLCPFSLALAAAAPPGVRERIITAWHLKATETDLPLTKMQKEIVKSLAETGGTLVQKPNSKLPKQTIRALKLLRGKGLVGERLQLMPIDEKPQASDLLRLSSDSEKLERFLKKDGKKKPAQALTIMRLQTGDAVPLEPSEIKALSGVTDSTLKAMIEAGLLERIEQGSLLPIAPPQPNPAQQNAIDEISSSIDARRFQSFLLHGVTGSGKTEVYLRAASKVLQAGRQVLYLVPEIALATQAISQLRERFGSSVSLLHSDLSPRERLETWMRIRHGKSSVILGARSALFAPLTNLGLIVVDEEHEGSYKQESAPRYHAKRLALFLGEMHNAAVVLGSATPSVESYFEAENGAHTLLALPERTASATLPTVHVVDLTEGYKTGQPSILTSDLSTRLEQSLERNEQAILFLNRRAYSPFLICRDCGHQFRCPRCAVALSFSRQDRRLRCHHCGFTRLPPQFCPACQGHRLNPFGIGTEKVEEVVKESFPSATVARLDRDVARKKGVLEETLARFRSGDINILVGTQMVAKGLDFPNVTLVGVIAADTSLNVPDFRSSERTFQLLSQVAGRAGRGAVPGYVIFQTFNPLHIAVTAARDHDYVAFYRSAKAERMEAMYPPFLRLINVIFTGESLAEVTTASQEAADQLQTVEDAILLGPTECPIERIQGRWRRHLLLKVPSNADPGRIGAMVRSTSDRTVAVIWDVDPYSLM